VNPADAVTKSRLLAMLEDVAGSLDEHCSAPLEPEAFQHLDVVVPPPLGPVPTRDREPTLFVEVIDEHPYTRGIRMRLQYRPPVGAVARQELLAPAGIDDKLLCHSPPHRSGVATDCYAGW
jgi:hypothetical protein